MGFNLVGPMPPAIVYLCKIEPVFGDPNGRFQYIPNLNHISAQLRKNCC